MRFFSITPPNGKMELAVGVLFLASMIGSTAYLNIKISAMTALHAEEVRAFKEQLRAELEVNVLAERLAREAEMKGVRADVRKNAERMDKQLPPKIVVVPAPPKVVVVPMPAPTANSR